MLYSNYADHEFMDYLNRHLTGIFLFKNEIRKISLSYSLSEAFSNHACRFYIDIDFFNYENLTEEDKRKINSFFIIRAIQQEVSLCLLFTSHKKVMILT